MLFDSQKLTDGLIIYSALISDFEKLDFKNDALAGVRANYFNSNKQSQYDKSEISLEEKTYNISYRMSENEPLSWKITRNNQPFQSVKKVTGGVYSVIFYRENGIIYKRSFFDKAHNWLRTEYYDNYYENVKVAVVAPKIIKGITALQLERINIDGEHNYSVLYPSESVPMKKCAGLIYSNVGMLWYDEIFRPEDLPVENLSSDDNENSGFKFNNADEIFELSQTADSLNMADAEYLDEPTCNSTESENTSEEKTDKKENEQSYSAYDKIASILSEAHKTNKDLFGEIINQTSSDFYEQEKADEISEDSVAAAESEDTNSEESEENTGHVSENPDSNFVVDETQEEYDSKENPDCDVIIHTKSGRYAYFGYVDENNNRTGRGRTVTPQGLTSYDGEYLDDQRNGFGVCYYKEGNINYVGNWINGKREGCGVGYRLSDGTMHAGKWSDNSPDGCGARFDSEGNFIDVCFYTAGKRNGKSVSFDENGRVIIKNWVDGELVSEFAVDDEA
ncbi:hypothetical protein [Ruminococcus sp.]|uniref:hypothetical protein n=1 Tax=Ruminococcus sp. TaxID=41978 RepID=UPI0026044D46|nr:hypothetical protein [Ruminococcus sp.]MDD6989939.1 hypothetical protein [Ruminococcus sp.]MDY6201008.1 hypothetical protein [Ruminococcus sp.]